MSRTFMANARWSVVTLALVWLVSTAALARTTVDDILIRCQHNPTKVNIRVDIYNPDSATLQGPIRVNLFVRGSSNEEWRQIFTYPAIGKVRGGRHIALDYFAPSHHVDSAIRSGNFQVRAVAVFPDGHESQFEKSYP